MSFVTFQLPFDKYVLKGDRYRKACDTLVLHGAGKSSRIRFSRLRESLNDNGIPSSSFDFIGQSFGPEFSAAIRTPGSWQDSDAFCIISGFKGNLLLIAAEVDDVIPMALIERIYSSAENARSRHFHIVPNSRHLSLFPKEQDFIVVLNMIIDVWRKGCDNDPVQATLKTSVS